MIPKISSERIWTTTRVRKMCEKHGLYIFGKPAEYEEMLGKVQKLSPDVEGLYAVAKDIAAHSDRCPISEVMYLLEKEAVRTLFEIEGEDDE